MRTCIKSVVNQLTKLTAFSTLVFYFFCCPFSTVVVPHGFLCPDPTPRRWPAPLKRSGPADNGLPHLKISLLLYPHPLLHISLSNNDFPWPILNPLPGPLAQLFSLISARFIFSLLVLHHSLLFHRIPSSAFKHIHITYSTVRSTFFFFFWRCCCLKLSSYVFAFHQTPWKGNYCLHHPNTTFFSGPLKQTNSHLLYPVVLGLAWM